MALFNKFRGIGKVYNNLRGFASKRNIYNIVRNYNPITGYKNTKKAIDMVPERVRNKAKLAKGGYLKPEERKDIGDYKYITGDDELAVYQKGDKIKFSHRGTSNKDDILTDSFVLNNNLAESDRYKRTKGKIDKYMKEFGSDKRYSHLGHSLGSSLAKELGREFGHKSKGFNGGQSTIYKDNPLHKNYVIRGDPVSNSLLFQDKNVEVYKPQEQGKNNHSLSNFLW